VPDPASPDRNEAAAGESARPERRVWDRFTLAIPAYLRLDAQKELTPVRTINLSVGGFHCVTTAALEIGRVVRASLALTPHNIFHCKAQVIRVDELGDGAAFYKVGFRFVDLTNDKERVLAEALEALKGETDELAIPTAWKSRAEGE
jgi:hypothetical protein